MDNIQAETAHYNALPVEFNGFINVPTLSNGEIFLLWLRVREAGRAVSTQGSTARICGYVHTRPTICKYIEWTI